MTDQNNALIVGIARIIDHPSVYMGGPSRNSLRIAKMIVKEFGADIASADRAAPEGQVRGANRSDGGFSDPAPQPAAPTDNTALVEAAYHAGIDAAANRYRVCASPDVWDYFYTAYNAMLDLKTFPMPAALASREAQQPAGEAMPVGCGHPCSYDCNGAYFDQPACQQEAVTVAEAAEVLLKARDALEDKIEKQDGGTYWMPPEESQLRLLDAIALRALKGENE